MSESVSGIVVNYKTKELTAAAVESLLGEPELAEVVIVDNDSSDGSVPYLRDRLPPDRVKVLESGSNVGFGQGVNIGASESKGSLLFILNSDAVLEPGGLVPLVRYVQANEKVAMVAPWILSPDGSVQVDSHGVFPTFRTMLLRTNRHPPDKLDPDWVSGVAMLVRREVFEQVNGFDPEFHMYLEDVDLCRRLRAQGWDIARVRESRVSHALSASSVSKDRENLYHESLMLLLRKTGAPALQVRLLGAAHMLWSSTRSTRSALSGSVFKRHSDDAPGSSPT